MFTSTCTYIYIYLIMYQLSIIYLSSVYLSIYLSRKEWMYTDTSIPIWRHRILASFLPFWIYGSFLQKWHTFLPVYFIYLCDQSPSGSQLSPIPSHSWMPSSPHVGSPCPILLWLLLKVTSLCGPLLWLLGLPHPGQAAPPCGCLPQHPWNLTWSHLDSPPP